MDWEFQLDQWINSVVQLLLVRRDPVMPWSQPVWTGTDRILVSAGLPRYADGRQCCVVLRVTLNQVVLGKSSSWRRAGKRVRKTLLIETGGKVRR